MESSDAVTGVTHKRTWAVTVGYKLSFQNPVHQASPFSRSAKSCRWSNFFQLVEFL